MLIILTSNHFLVTSYHNDQLTYCWQQDENTKHFGQIEALIDLQTDTRGYVFDLITQSPLSVLIRGDVNILKTL